MYSNDMVLRRGLALLLLCALASLAGAQHSDTVFPPEDPLRRVVKPIQIGMEAFSSKMEAIKALGREPLGLVLAGGSARAYAYIGMLEVLEERGIYPDFIVANSMGAIIGLLYAAGLSPAMIGELVTTVPIEKYFDLVFPFNGGLINVDAFEAIMKDLIGEVDISELPIPVIITAEDLNTRRKTEIAAGDFSRVMSSSFAMPAIFEPKAFEDALMVDGGSTTLVPIAQAVPHSSLLIVATALYNRPLSYGNPITVLNRVFDIGKTRTGMEDLLSASPFIIRNDVEGISYMEFSRPKGIILRGRESAESAMDDLVRWLPPEAVQSRISPDLEAKRKHYKETLAPKLDAYRRGALPRLDASLRLSPYWGLLRPIQPAYVGIDMLGFGGLGIRLAAGGTRAFLGGLVGLGSAQSGNWAVTAELLTNPWDSLIWGSQLRMLGDFGNDFPYLKPESLGLSSGLWWELGEENKKLEPFVSTNLEYELTSGNLGWETETGLSVAALSLGGSSGAKEGIGNASSYYSLRASAFAQGGALPFGWGPSLGLGAGLSIADSACLRSKVSGRSALNGAGMGIGRWELYRGKAPNILAAFSSTASIELAWYARALEFDAGEFLLGNSVELGTYIDFLWYTSDGYPSSKADFLPKTFTAGLSLSATLRIAGLNPLELSIFGGVSDLGDFSFGIRSGRLFPAGY